MTNYELLKAYEMNELIEGISCFLTH